MGRLSKWSQINLLLSMIFIIVGFLVPIFIEKFKYRGDMVEVESVVKNIAENENSNYALQNEYIAIKKNQQAIIPSKFSGIRKDDLKYYDYTITTTMNSFTILAEPKIKFLKTRDIPPKIYSYTHILNSHKPDKGKWSTL